MFHSFLGLLSFDHWPLWLHSMRASRHPYHWFCCANCTSGWYIFSILLFCKVVVYRCTHQNSHLWLSEPLRPSIEHSSFQLDCGCLPEDLSGISSRYRTASATEDHPSRKEKSFVDEDESYSDDYDSDYETDPAAKIDDTMKGTVLAVAVTKKVDRRSCSMSRSMEASPQRQSGENIIAISLSQLLI